MCVITSSIPDIENYRATIGLKCQRMHFNPKGSYETKRNENEKNAPGMDNAKSKLYIKTTVVTSHLISFCCVCFCFVSFRFEMCCDIPMYFRSNSPVLYLFTQADLPVPPSPTSSTLNLGAFALMTGGTGVTLVEPKGPPEVEPNKNEGE